MLRIRLHHLVLFGILISPPASTWAAEPPLQVGRSLFAAPRPLSFAGETSAAAVSGLERATLRALRSGTVERLLLAEGGGSIVLERQLHELRSTAATWVGGTPDGRWQLVLTVGDDHLFGRLVSDSGETLLVPGPEPFTTKLIRPVPGLEMEFTDCVDHDPMLAAAPRSDTASAFPTMFTNRWLWIACAVAVGLQVVVVHAGPLNDAFDTEPLSLSSWVVCAALSSVVLWFDELRKLVLRRIG